jgi:signal transduction histidine kinase
MKIGTRLWLAVAPGVVGVITVAALAYWGELGRQVPATVVVVAAAATALSIGLAWWTVRHVVRRIERLAQEAAEVRRRVVEAGFEALRSAGIADASPDELESLEGLVTRLAEMAVTAERSARAREAAAARRLRESGALLRGTAADLGAQLDEVRLPLHILLENRFGDLNENQEEMLGAARGATDALAESVRRTLTVLSARDGALSLRRDRIHAGELVDGLLVRLRTAADARGTRLEVQVDAPLPALDGDRVLLQEALEALFVSTLRQATGAAATFRAAVADAHLEITLVHSGSAVVGMPARFGESIVAAHAGTVAISTGTVVARLPLAPSTP